MTLRIRRIGINNFRKFREPIAIEGLTDGLNIVIEPNEAGKSTVLEALRAAFFVRYSTRNQLAQSFAPHGEAVAPEVEVAFEVNGEEWSVAKRFLKGQSIEVRSPNGRAQGDDAEARLQELLGFVRDTSQRGDPSTYGALGLLWVTQTDGLEVSAPGAIVRDTVRSTLEAEVGTIMGGASYESVRRRIEEQYVLYWTPTGRPTGKQSEASDRYGALREEASAAANRLAVLEKTFAELDSARDRLSVVERDLADETDATERATLVTALDTARTAAQLLSTRKAEHEAARAKLEALEYLQSRLDNARKAVATTEAALLAAKTKRTSLSTDLSAARALLEQARTGRIAARDARQGARDALAAGVARTNEFKRKSAIAAARTRYQALLDLQARHAAATELSATLIPGETLKELEAHDRAVAEARAAVRAGATIIELVREVPGVTLDGQPMMPGPTTITRETSITLGEAELVIRPPVSATSAEARLAEALEVQAFALAEVDVKDLAAARARNDAARDAAANLRALDVQIRAETPADELLGLAAGPEALKLFVTALEDEAEEEAQGEDDLDALAGAVEEAEAAVARAEGVYESADENFRSLEEQDGLLAQAEAGAERDLGNARDRVVEIENRPDFAELESGLAKARQDVAAASVRLAEAERDATAHDASSIARKIETIDARVRVTSERRTALLQDIARLETTIETEGGKGLADRAAMAREEAEDAGATLAGVTEEAATLKLLREVLDEARAEASRTFVGPVALRAKRHIERLLPGCNLTFGEDFGLESVVRAGVSEGCGHLSKGTQEQLSILTRLAFADMLLEQGAPVSFILDDPFAYADDVRLDLMTDILSEAAERMQVILLTCRDRAFRHLDGNRIRLSS